MFNGKNKTVVNNSKKNILILSGVTLSSAVITALIVSLAAGSFNVQIFRLMPIAGLVIAIATLLPVSVSKEARISVAISAAFVAMAIIACCNASLKQQWSSSEHIPDNEINMHCQKIIALQTCHQNKIMGVFDYNDVPSKIKQQAVENVQQMTLDEKLKMCNRIFASRINAQEKSRLNRSASVLGLFAATLLISVIPTIVKYRN